MSGQHKIRSLVTYALIILPLIAIVKPPKARYWCHLGSSCLKAVIPAKAGIHAEG